MGTIQEIKDPTLQKIVDEIEAKLPDPKMKTGYQQIVVAGMKVLYSEQTHQILMQKIQAAKQGGNVPKAVVEGTVQLIALLYQQSKQQMYLPAAVPAGVTLMCYIFEFVEQMGLVQITPDIVAAATKMVTAGILKQFGVTKEQLAAGIDHLRASGQPAGSA